MFLFVLQREQQLTLQKWQAMKSSSLEPPNILDLPSFSHPEFPIINKKAGLKFI
jgi:hypothetical protein